MYDFDNIVDAILQNEITHQERCRIRDLLDYIDQCEKMRNFQLQNGEKIDLVAIKQEVDKAKKQLKGYQSLNL